VGASDIRVINAQVEYLTHRSSEAPLVLEEPAPDLFNIPKIPDTPKKIPKKIPSQ
jgi:hypothetical protein